MELPINTIMQGHVLQVLKTLPDSSVDMCVTSPPYWALRSYKTEPQVWDAVEGCEHEWGEEIIQRQRGTINGETAIVGNQIKGVQETEIKQGNFCTKCNAWRGELGSEPSPELYVKHLCDIFDEVKRALKPTGSCYVNLGDTYSGSGCGTNDYRTEASRSIQGVGKGSTLYKTGGIAQKLKSIPPKSLCMIPDRFAIEMINRGWILRNKIIWKKRNCIPSSARDRYTNDFEEIFFFVKSRRYYYEQQFEAWTDTNPNDTSRAIDKHPGYHGKYGGGYNEGARKFLPGQGIKGQPVGDPMQGRNKRAVWDVTTRGFPGAHTAVFPETLIETPIRASCPEYVCNKCGKPREKIIDIVGKKVTKEMKYAGGNNIGKYKGL